MVEKDENENDKTKDKDLSYLDTNYILNSVKSEKEKYTKMLDQYRKQPNLKQSITRDDVINILEEFNRIETITNIENEYSAYKNNPERTSGFTYFKTKNGKYKTNEFSMYVDRKPVITDQIYSKIEGSTHTNAMITKRKLDLKRIDQIYDKKPILVPNTELRPFQYIMYNKLDKYFKIGQFAQLKTIPYPKKPT